MADIHEYKCPHCGGAVTFDSSTQKMKCPYCDTEFEIDAMNAFESAVSDSQDEMNWNSSDEQWNVGEDGLITYVCKSCGGEIIGDENMGASSCPYCGNPIVVMDKFSGTLKPNYIIPFKLDKEAAKAALEKHLKGKTLLPKVFKNQNHIDEIKGIYVPFWFYDTGVDACMNYKATKTRTWEDANNRYTETSYYGVTRGGTIAFKNVPADGSSKMDDDLMESIEPFNFSEAVDFKNAYLSGYLADKYDVTSEACTPRVNERIKVSTEDAFKKTVQGYATVNAEGGQVRFFDSMVKYALCPVWILNTSWKGEKFTFAMNGQTGKMVGNLPMDKGAYWKWFGIVSAATTAAAFVISMFLS